MKQCFCFILMLLFGLILTAQTGIYVVDQDGTLYLFNPETCESAIVGELGASFLDIAINPIDGQMYGVNDLGSLYAIDINTGATTLISSTDPSGFGPLSGTTALTCDDNGVLYGASSVFSQIYSIDLNTGAIDQTWTNATGEVSSGDLTFLDGAMYLTSLNGNLVEINPNDPSSAAIVGQYVGGFSFWGITTAAITDDCTPTMFAFDQNDVYELPSDDLLNPTLLCSDITADFMGAISFIYGAASLSETTTIDCDDDDCATIDSYDSATCQCFHEAITPEDCDDDDCSTADTYDASLCECVNNPIPIPDCDDDDCGTTDSYDALTCLCVNEPLPLPDCDDGDCGTTDIYYPLTCECESTPITPIDCDDGDCLTADVYNVATCECENNPIEPGACDDGDCTTQDEYDVDLCECIHNPIPPPDCDDNDCGTLDNYDPITCECLYELIPPNSCDDENCATSDSYDTMICECVNTPLPLPNCDDGDCNTDDVYDATICECVYTPNFNCTDQLIVFPNAFTPNNDGINDQFKAITTETFTQFELSIYNRWGQQIFLTNDINQGWDGSLQGEEAILGVYVYQARIVLADGEIINRKGNITLLR